MYSGVLIEFLNMGGGEIALIMVVVLLLFGGKKLPELARGLGKGIREFKDASEGVKREIHRNINNVGLEEELKAEEKEVGGYTPDEHAVRHHPVEEETPAATLDQPLAEQAAVVPEPPHSESSISLEKKNKETDL
jgi:sec-independent protein translocase protein TatA